MKLRMILALLVAGSLTLSAQAHGPQKLETAIFAGGCFWCMEPEFKDVQGVHSAMVGYTGGEIANPTYSQVSKGYTKHYEAIQVNYDPEKVSYQQLLDIYWRNIDPLNGEGQFCDKGPQYRAAIFYADDHQKELAEASKETVEDRLDEDVETQIKPISPFYVAEDYHQEFYIKNYERYNEYKEACGREERLNELWSQED